MSGRNTQNGAEDGGREQEQGGTGMLRTASHPIDREREKKRARNSRMAMHLPVCVVVARVGC